MNELETRLTETLSTRAERGPGTDEVLAGLNERRIGGPAPRRARWVLPAVVVAGAMVVVVGALVWLQPSDSSTPADDPAPATEPVVPDGMRLVGWGRVAVAVPDGWRTTAGSCPPGEDDVVQFKSFANVACPLINVRGVSTLELMSSHTQYGRSVAKASDATELDGLELLRTDRELVVPSEGVLFRASGSDQIVDWILDSVQVLPETWTSVPYWHSPSAQHPPTVPGLNIGTHDVWRPDAAAGEIVGLRPTSGTVLPVGSTVTLLIQTDRMPLGQVDADHRITTWHCGINPTTFAGRTWEVPWPTPFDGTNAPRPFNDPPPGEAFTGHGSMELVAEDRAVYTDDGGVRLTFLPAGTPGAGTPENFLCM